MTYAFRADLWLHDGEAGWHFVTVPPELADEIGELTAGERRGFGSVKVRASIGATSWDTSLFPDTASRSFVLPVKQQVRRDEGLTVGDPVDVRLEIVVP